MNRADYPLHTPPSPPPPPGREAETYLLQGPHPPTPEGGPHAAPGAAASLGPSVSQLLSHLPVPPGGALLTPPPPGTLAGTGHRAAGAGLAGAQRVSVQMTGGPNLSAPGASFVHSASSVPKATIRSPVYR